MNDRIFEVMPNYGTVENTDTLPPISTGQKFRLATAGVFDYFTYPFIGTLAAVGQANNSPKSWGQGWGAYGKRFGASFADNGIASYMTSAIFPSMLREDPRYYQKGKGTFFIGRSTRSAGCLLPAQIPGTLDLITRKLQGMQRRREYPIFITHRKTARQRETCPRGEC